MRHLFIINPAAGRPESTARLETLLSRLSFPHEVAYTREAGDAQRLAATAARTGGPVRIYACGGDGTLNEVVNGAAGFDNAAVTCVPKGTGNDCLKLFGPRFRELFYDLEALAAGPQRAFDLMDCNGKLGLDVVCAGVDARIAAGVHRYKDLRFVSGIGAYLLSLAEQVIFRGLCRPLTIRADGLDWQERQTAILCIGNGRHSGGGWLPWRADLPGAGVMTGRGRSAASLSSAWWASTPRGSTGSTPNLSPTGTASPSPFPPPGRSPWWWTARSCAGPASPSASPP